ncbi:hypothetical protein [Streptomyces sp. CAU 1734]|uniref:hypothetical protein n=1 Tax=Streptomyces sp. CAU 1734 TaxID=3140360 RepID=UPI003260EBB4
MTGVVVSVPVILWALAAGCARATRWDPCAAAGRARAWIAARWWVLVPPRPYRPRRLSALRRRPL